MKFTSGVFCVIVITVLEEMETFKFFEGTKFGFVDHIKNKSLTHPWMQLLKCKSGFNMFKNVILCDGKIDCSDRSDETIEQCLNNNCAPGFFRCDYGACIPRSEVCNGLFNCVDGSDENIHVCAASECTVPYSTNMTVYYVNLKGIWRPGGAIVEDGTILQYSCTTNSKDVYNLLKVICRNGSWKPFLPTCADWEDVTASSSSSSIRISTTTQETPIVTTTEKKIASTPSSVANISTGFFSACAPGFFRCDYGVCIPRSEVCNGLFNCVDGSDENLHVCAASECTVPHSTNMTVYHVNLKGIWKPGGAIVEDGTILQYSCTANSKDVYNLLNVICRNGSWKPFLPTCADREDVTASSSRSSIRISTATQETPIVTTTEKKIAPSSVANISTGSNITGAAISAPANISTGSNITDAAIPAPAGETPVSINGRT